MVVEAAPRSGSLITARLAAESGREVMAVPGSPLDPRAQGCNQLIRDGATLVQTAEDVMEAIRPFEGKVESAPRAVSSHRLRRPKPMSCATSTIEELLGPQPGAGRRDRPPVGRPSGAVQMVLLELELAGRLERHAGGKVSLR